MRRIAALLVLLASRHAVASTAADLCAPAADPCVVATAVTVTPGSTLDLGTRQLDVQGTGSITIGGGQLTILAGSVRIESHADIFGGVSGGTAANISIFTSGDIRVDTGASGDGAIDASAGGNTGTITLAAHGDVVIAGRVTSNGSTTFADGGVINITADGNVTVSGAVRALGGSQALGGEITIQAGGSDSVTGAVRADGGDGGDVEIDALNGDITSPGTVDASADGSSDDGGTVTLIASRNLSVSGTIGLAGTGDDLDGGGTGGDADLEGTAGTVSVTGTVDNHGPAPDGDAGEIDVTAGTDYTQTGTMYNDGRGADGCGGTVFASAGRQMQWNGLVMMAGPDCGGDLSGDAASVSVPAGAEINADSVFDAGSATLTGQHITVAGRVHAIASDPAGRGGFVQVAGCTIGVASGGRVQTDGVGGENLLQASGQLTIGGLVSSFPTGLNRFEFLNPLLPPIVLGSASISPTPVAVLTPTLPACAAAAVCGNGVVEPGEDCDDGNTLACDGCSPTCQVERCGNGTLECGEECDDGLANGAPGDPCDASCHVIQAANTVFIPAARRGGHGCFIEWAVRVVPAGGFPSSTVACMDGDPTCDEDGANDGGCTFRVSTCLNVTDPRLPKCTAQPLSYVKLRRPSPLRPADTVESGNAQQLVSAVEALGVSLYAGDTVLQQSPPYALSDQCSASFLQRVTHPPNAVGRRLLSAGATGVAGASNRVARTSNRIALSCLPNPAVCGNGVVEVGEECDDGNTAACDGCSPTCRRERCGDGVVSCGEQCDDGPLNGTPGDGCSVGCRLTPPPERIPGGAGHNDCLTEWSLAGNLAVTRSGLPSTKQVCVDNDPTCDFDPTPGRCRLHLWECFGADDARIQCAANAVAGYTLVKPTPTDFGLAGAARLAILGGVASVPFPAGPGEACSGRMDIDVAAGRHRLVIKAQANTSTGTRDRDTLKLTCAPAPAASAR